MKVFLCAAKGVSVGVAFNRKIGVGLFGGEGLFFATLTGPGTVWLQSIPFGCLAAKINQMAPARREEGSALGTLGNLFDGN